MARTKKITIAALNIKFTEEEKQFTNNYIELWKFLRENKVIGRTRSKQAIMLSPSDCRNVFEGEPERGLYGSIHKYYDLDPHSSWFNTENATLVEEQDAISIPENMKPESAIVEYVFYPKKHILCFNANILKPFSAYYAFSAMLQSEEVQEKFGMLEVIPIADRAKIEDLIQLPQKMSVRVKVTLPNPDDISELEKQVFERLNRSNIQSEARELKSKDSNGIELEEEVQDMIRASARNGHTVIIVREGKDTKTYSTKKIPQTHVIRYNPDEQSSSDAIMEASKNGDIF